MMVTFERNILERFEWESEEKWYVFRESYEVKVDHQFCLWLDAFISDNEEHKDEYDDFRNLFEENMWLRMNEVAASRLPIEVFNRRQDALNRLHELSSETELDELTFVFSIIRCYKRLDTINAPAIVQKAFCNGGWMVNVQRTQYLRFAEKEWSELLNEYARKHGFTHVNKRIDLDNSPLG